MSETENRIAELKRQHETLVSRPNGKASQATSCSGAIDNPSSRPPAPPDGLRSRRSVEARLAPIRKNARAAGQ